MRMAMMGLGRMGANMLRRLRRGGIEVVDTRAREDGRVAADSLADRVSRLQMPRVVWVMLPAGEITETCLASLEFGA